VCLHGVTGHGRRFRKLAEERLASRFHVLAPDLRGHGRSAWDEPWGLETHVADVLATVRMPAAWVGHSFGGRIVMEIAARAPERVERAVLLDPAILVPPDIAQILANEEGGERSFATVEEAIRRRSESGGLVRTPRELLEEEMREHLVAGDDGRLRYRYAPPAVATAYLELARRRPPDFERLCVPTLLVVAAHSKLVSAGELELYRAALGELLEVVVVPGGHIVLWEAFAETAAAVEAFLAR
jgi:lipase